MGFLFHKIYFGGFKMPDQELLTIEEMAEKLKVKTSWLYFRTMHTGANSIPRVKIGKYLRFNPGAVMEWIEAQYNG
jgi:excisionase family DNA binding protein